MEGWIKIHRSIQSKPDYFSEPFTRIMAFIDLNLLANHSDGFIRQRGIRVEIKRGQVGASRETLAKRWKWSQGKVTRFLQELECDGEIVQQKTNVINCITLLNYDCDTASGTANKTANSPANWTADDTAGYTTDSSADDTANGRQTVQQTDGKRAADSTANPYIRYARKNEKNVENEKNCTHTDSFSVVEISSRARARAILDWLNENLPTVQQMPQPLTEDQAVWLAKKYTDEDIRRIFAALDNKGATKNKSAYSTFVSFAGHDAVLKERAAARGKLYTYNEKCDLIYSRKYTEDDFIGRKIDGKVYWIKKTDTLREVQL